jgi:hypothetical protein
MKSLMRRFQLSMDLLNLSLLSRVFEVMLLKKALVLCLSDGYTDSKASNAERILGCIEA